MKEGRFGEAAELLRGCLAMRQRELPVGHWLIAETNSQLGGAIAEEGRFTEAEPLLLEGYATMKEHPWAPTDRKLRAIRRIVRLYESWDKPDQTSEWRRRLEEATSDEVDND
jgi:hypothetical protein